MKRILGDIPDAHLNARPTKTLKRTVLRQKYQVERFLARSLGSSVVSPYPLLDSIEYTNSSDDTREILHEDSHSIPFTVSTANTCSLTALATELGVVRVFDHSHSLASKPDLFSIHEHTNAIFDISWSYDDRLLASASGDQLVNILDVQTQCIRTKLHGHSSTVKQVVFDPANPNLMATGGRDGLLALWDLRTSGSADGSKDIGTNTCSPIRPVSFVQLAHGTTSVATKLRTKAQTPPTSITSLLYLPQGVIASASAATARIKTWDPRYMRTATGTIHGSSESTRPDKSKFSCKALIGQTSDRLTDSGRQYGVCSLSLSADKQRIFSVNRDSKVYVYPTSHAAIGPIRAIDVPGLSVKTFYCKGNVSQDGSDLMAIGNGSGHPVLLDTKKAMASPGPRTVATDQENASMTMVDSDVRTILKTRTRASDHSQILADGHRLECTGIVFSHDSSTLVSIADDCFVKVWRRRAHL